MILRLKNISRTLSGPAMLSGDKAIRRRFGAVSLAEIDDAIRDVGATAYEPCMYQLVLRTGARTT
jgi:hypothetical protein